MPDADSINVLVIHDNPIAQAGLTAGLGRYRGIKVLPCPASPKLTDAADLASTADAVDVVLADYEAGLALMEKCGAPNSPMAGSKVMIITPSDRESDIRHALGRGARGYMLLDSDFDDLVHGVREVHMGVRALSPRVAQQLAESVTADALSLREVEVVRLVVDGLSNKLIARRLDIAVGTVKSHLKSIFDKLQATSRTQVIAVAVRRGLLSNH